MCLLLNGMGDLVTVGTGMAEVLNASFTSVFTSKVSWAVRPREGGKGELPLPQKNTEASIS